MRLSIERPILDVREAVGEIRGFYFKHFPEWSGAGGDLTIIRMRTRVGAYPDQDLELRSRASSYVAGRHNGDRGEPGSSASTRKSAAYQE